MRQSLFNIKRLTEIPSEYLEPYLKDFLSVQIEGVGCGLTTCEDARSYLRGVEYFVSVYCGIHAHIATSNVYDKFIHLSNDEMIKICREVVNSTV